MSTTFEVHAIRLGTIRADKSGTVYGYPKGTVLDVPIWAAAIEGGGRKILVDTGIRDAAKWSRDRAAHDHARGDDRRRAGGAGLAVAGDVDIVINSHLHYDHAENNLAFPQAQFYVSDEEWRWASDPSSAQAWAYDIEWTGDEVTFMNYCLRPARPLRRHARAAHHPDAGAHTRTPVGAGHHRRRSSSA